MVLVGAGGAGRAVAFALMDLGVATVVLHDREAHAAGDADGRLARITGGALPACGRSRAGHRGGRRCRQCDAGRHARLSRQPGAGRGLARGHWAADVIYTPIETAFIKAAAAKGARVLTGGGMCVHQAAEAFRLFIGVEPDVERMHRTFARALAARDAAHG